MTKLDLFLIVYPVDYLKEILIPERKKIRNIQWNLENSFSGCDVGSTWVYEPAILTGGTGGQQKSRQSLKVQFSDLSSICQGPLLKVS